MARRRARPWQYGLASLFWLTTAVAFAIWLDVPYFLHLGSVFVQILVALAGISLVGALILAPFAAFSLLQWLIEDSNWETLVEQVREFRFRKRPHQRHKDQRVRRPPAEDGALSDTHSGEL